MKKKGISLIALIITVIVVLILAGAIILSLSKNNPILQSREASFKHTVGEYNSELTLWIINEYGKQKGKLDIKNINASKNEGTYNDLRINDIIKSMRNEDLDKFEIQEAKLIYVGKDINEKEWLKNIDGETTKTEEDNQMVDVDIPSLTWSKLNYSDFGYTNYGGETKINVYDNGNAKIAVYYAKTPYMSYYNKETKKWTLSNVSWWNNGAPEILYAANGVFLAKMVGLANIISSYDGITWYNAGFCAGAKNSITTGAYDANTGSGIVSFWYYQSPIYYSFDSLTERTEWILVGKDGISVPIFKYLTSHKGKFIGVVGGDLSIAAANTSNPAIWTTTIPQDNLESRYMFIRSIHDKLFVMKWHSKKIDGNFVYYVRLGVLSDDGTEFIETNLYHEGDLANNKIANPQNIIWMEQWQRFVLFNEGMLYTSVDGITWEGVKQNGLTTRPLVTFEGAIYVPGDGFYLSMNDSYVYYAPYIIE